MIFLSNSFNFNERLNNFFYLFYAENRLYSSYYTSNDRSNIVFFASFIEINVFCNFIIFNDTCLPQKKNIYYSIRYSRTKTYCLVKKQKHALSFFFQNKHTCKKLADLAAYEPWCKYFKKLTFACTRAENLLKYQIFPK